MMKTILIRILKLLIGIIFFILIVIPFAIVMWSISIIILIPLFAILYIVYGDAEKSLDMAFDISINVSDIGVMPMLWINDKFLNEK